MPMEQTSEEKGSALFHGFVQQSDQNNLDERKAVWKVLDRILTEAGLNDNLITDLEFTEAPSADRVRDVRTQTRAVLQNTASTGFDQRLTEHLTL